MMARGVHRNRYFLLVKNNHPVSRSGCHASFEKGGVFSSQFFTLEAETGDVRKRVKTVHTRVSAFKLLNKKIMQPEKSVQQADGILARLKTETRSQHQQTEGDVDLMRDDFNKENYRDLLVKFYRFYKPYEAKVSEMIGQNGIDFNHHERLNTPKLEKDLRELGMSDEEIAAIETTDDLPRLDSSERVFGSLYVIEGSTLGGQVISRHLKQSLGLDETNGVAFFSGYGRDTGPMWKGFGKAITNFADQSDNHDEIIAAAIETFEKIGNALNSK
jgi:heme oxygenase